MSFLYSQFFVTPASPDHSFAGQTVIVTGSNVGLGLEAARHIVRLGAEKVILAVRNVPSGEEAKQSIEETTGRKDVCEVWKIDLASYASVIEFAERASKLPRLDIVVENAAIIPPQPDIAEGHELSMTVNVISTMLLAFLLWPKLNETAKKFPDIRPCLSIVVSDIHSFASFRERKESNIFAALDDTKKINASERYATTKLIEILLIREFASRIPTNSRVVINMHNPGLCHSELGRNAGFALWLMKKVAARSTEVGSRTLVAGAAGGPESHGAYMTDGKVANDALSSFVRSKEGEKTQKQLWKELSDILEKVKPGVMSVETLSEGA